MNYAPKCVSWIILAKSWVKCLARHSRLGPFFSGKVDHLDCFLVSNLEYRRPWMKFRGFWCSLQIPWLKPSNPLVSPSQSHSGPRMWLGPTQCGGRWNSQVPPEVMSCHAWMGGCMYDIYLYYIIYYIILYILLYIILYIIVSYIILYIERERDR